MNYIEYISESLSKTTKVPLRFINDTYWSVMTTHQFNDEKTVQVGEPKFEWRYCWNSPKMSITHKDIDVEVSIIETYKKSVKIKIKYLEEFENEFLLYINETKSPAEIYATFNTNISNLLNETLMEKKGEEFFLEEEEKEYIKDHIKQNPFLDVKKLSIKKIRSIRIKKHFFKNFSDENIIDHISIINPNDINILKILTNEEFMIYNGKDYMPIWNWNVEKLKTLTRKQLIDLYDYFVWGDEFYENYSL